MSGLPDLDSRACEAFTYRQLCECGDSWARGRPDNRPRQPATFTALARLGQAILDPLSARFGRPTLTYGFAGLALIALRPRHTAPRLDQHAGHELGRSGLPICARLGQAVDLFVPGRSSLALARFIIDQTPFDRLYLYGADRPLHVSCGPQQSRQVVLMRTIGTRRVPTVLTGQRLAQALDQQDVGLKS